MLSLKKKSRSKKSGLSHSSSSRLDSINDRDYRVVMLCEEIPVEKSSVPGRGSRHPGACSTRGSELDPQNIQMSRARRTHGRACYVEREPNAVHEGFIHKVYGCSLNLMLTKSPSVVQDSFCADFAYNDFFLDYYLSKTQILNAPCYANMSSDRTLCTTMRCLSHLCAITNWVSSLSSPPLLQAKSLQQHLKPFRSAQRREKL